MVRFRHIAPAGAPLRARDLVGAAGLLLSRSDVHAQARAAFCSRFGVRHSFLTSTGRAGMTILLRALKRLTDADRNEVVLPAYTCYSVAASVVKAGLSPRLVDINPATLDFAPDALAKVNLDRAVAIIGTNLYGLPNDAPAIAAAARRHGAFFIDDAAQAMGATVGGKWSGTCGDAGLFSLDKGKNVSAIDGGVIVTNSDAIADAMHAEMRSVGTASAREAGTGAAKALAYYVMLRPWLYWIPNRIPQLGLGQTVFTTDYPLELPPSVLTALAVRVLDRLDDLTRARIANADALLAGLARLPQVTRIAPGAGTVPVYLRLPVLMASERQRDEALEALSRAGIGATASYPRSLADVPEIRRWLAGETQAIGARYVARHIMTLPTHAFATAADVTRTIETLTKLTGPAPVGRGIQANEYTG